MMMDTCVFPMAPKQQAVLYSAACRSSSLASRGLSLHDHTSECVKHLPYQRYTASEMRLQKSHVYQAVSSCAWTAGPTHGRTHGKADCL